MHVRCVLVVECVRWVEYAFLQPCVPIAKYDHLVYKLLAESREIKGATAGEEQIDSFGGGQGDDRIRSV